jgi:hypothetical protein
MNKLTIALFLALTSTAFASTWYVDGVNGNDQNDCKTSQTACKTIGHAISLAASGDSVVAAAARYDENITIGISLSVMGSGASTTVIDGKGKGIAVSVSNSEANVTLSRLTIQNGNPNGITNIGTLTITDSTVRNNSIYENCVNYCFAAGAGIRNLGGIVTIINSTIANNSITISCSGMYSHCFAFGGGISNEGGQMTIINSTLSGNSVSGGSFGAIYTSITYASLAIYSSTIAGNSASVIGGIVGVTTVITNSIVANNAGGNCSAAMASEGYNLSSDGTCNFSNIGDLNSIDPMLGPLQNNGGPTQTQALLSGSPAIDSGNPSGCTHGNGRLLKTDQRGFPRPDKEDSGGCDMGAYEKQSD